MKNPRPKTSADVVTEPGNVVTALGNAVTELVDGVTGPGSGVTGPGNVAKALGNLVTESVDKARKVVAAVMMPEDGFDDDDGFEDSVEAPRD